MVRVDHPFCVLCHNADRFMTCLFPVKYNPESAAAYELLQQGVAQGFAASHQAWGLFTRRFYRYG